MADEMQATDRRIQRTRRSLREALISLLVERGWDDINIQALCERADIGRSTFYLHFQNKEELLVSGFDDLRALLRVHPAMAKDGISGPMPFVRGLIEHVYEQRTLFRAIIGRRSGHIVQKRFRDMVNQLVKEEIPLAASEWKRDAAARYIAGALVELLAWWVDTGNERSVEDIEQLFHQLALPIFNLPGGNP